MGKLRNGVATKAGSELLCALSIRHLANAAPVCMQPSRATVVLDWNRTPRVRAAPLFEKMRLALGTRSSVINARAARHGATRLVRAVIVSTPRQGRFTDEGQTDSALLAARRHAVPA